MAKVGKKYAEAAKLFDKQKQYDVAEAIDILKKMDTAKFDETVEFAVNLNINPKYADQQLRGAWYCPGRHRQNKESPRVRKRPQGRRS